MQILRGGQEESPADQTSAQKRLLRSGLYNGGRPTLRLCFARSSSPRTVIGVSVFGLKPPLPPGRGHKLKVRSDFIFSLVSQITVCLRSVKAKNFPKRRRKCEKKCEQPSAIEGSGIGGMKLPIGMTRRALSYDDNLEAPMSTPPHDISINNLWRRPIIPERKFTRLAEEDEGAAVSQSAVPGFAPSRSTGVVKAKASSVIMNSLITKQTQDSMYRFEQRAGLSDTSYTPHKGLTAEETRHHHRIPESLQKLQIQSMEAREERQNSSAQSTPSNTPHSSPKQHHRSWFSSTGSEVSISSSNSSVDMGDAAGGGVVERWGVFGPRPLVQKSTSDLGSDPSTGVGFALQAYRGAQKPTPMEVMKCQTARLADSTVAQAAGPPKMEIPTKIKSKCFIILSIHPSIFIRLDPGPGRGGSSLSRDAQTSLTPDTSSSSSGGIPRRSQASRET
ncbi:hypothetical protein L3Q82_006616 [Scortum barcoo]|uniref:Uncharacterized protein n=1 Tax=Scortum barcoo TaxID=214431 RepID=A0ACB8X0T3_9TELE|nr:hypothetical protein L3Q82_006616 [Scortum barcoo]